MNIASIELQTSEPQDIKTERLTALHHALMHDPGLGSVSPATVVIYSCQIGAFIVSKSAPASVKNAAFLVRNQWSVGMPP